MALFIFEYKFKVHMDYLQFIFLVDGFLVSTIKHFIGWKSVALNVENFIKQYELKVSTVEHILYKFWRFLSSMRA